MSQAPDGGSSCWPRSSSRRRYWSRQWWRQTLNLPGLARKGTKRYGSQFAWSFLAFSGYGFRSFTEGKRENYHGENQLNDITRLQGYKVTWHCGWSFNQGAGRVNGLLTPALSPPKA